MIIRRDNRSLYGKIDGRLARPVMPIGYAHVHKDGSNHAIGANIPARPISGSPLCVVGNETWYSHGNYIGVKDTNTLWKPSFCTWPEIET